MRLLTKNKGYKKALIINFNGIGNGIVALPILKCIEESKNSFLYYHSYNSVLDNKSLMKKIKLKKLLGFVPTNWRRFNKKDWDEIYNFVKKNKIDLIINFRNEGPKYDKGYYQFKKRFKKEIEFWDLNFVKIKLRKKYRLLSDDILIMLKKHGIETGNYKPQFLKEYYGKKKQNTNRVKIGIFTGASQEIKRYSINKFERVVKLILKKYNCDLEIYNGTRDDECGLTSAIVSKIKNKNCSAISDKTFIQIINKFSDLDLLISNDTFAVHLASSLGIPVLGLYFATNPKIWGGDSDLFIFLRSKRGKKCKFQKKIAGNCCNYYGGCKKMLCKDITPEQILKSINQFKFIKKYERTKA